jgi:hypothetical protein
MSAVWVLMISTMDQYPAIEVYATKESADAAALTADERWGRTFATFVDECEVLS